MAKKKQMFVKGRKKPLSPVQQAAVEAGATLDMDAVKREAGETRSLFAPLRRKPKP